MPDCGKADCSAGASTDQSLSFSWLCDHEGTLLIDWGECGRYRLKTSLGELNGCNRCFHGEIEGLSPRLAHEASNIDVKVKYLTELSPVEKLLLGAGEGSEWLVRLEDGSTFMLELGSDGMNQVRYVEESWQAGEEREEKGIPCLGCVTQGGLGTWRLKRWTINDCDELIIAWGGATFEMRVDPGSKTMNGRMTGNIANAESLRVLTAEFVANVPCASCH